MTVFVACETRRGQTAREVTPERCRPIQQIQSSKADRKTADTCDRTWYAASLLTHHMFDDTILGDL
jgi:hypothetical protein